MRQTVKLIGYGVEETLKSLTFYIKNGGLFYMVDWVSIRG